MPMFTSQLNVLATEVIEAAKKRKVRIVIAESCTGGLLSACLTEAPGASGVFDRGFITYSNDSKMAQLDVDRKTLADFGAVSAECAAEMAEGALRASHADMAVSVTGIAGPGGGTAEKPVGLVYIGILNGKKPNDHVVLKHNFTGDRSAIRLATVEAALRGLKKEIGKI